MRLNGMDSTIVYASRMQRSRLLTSQQIPNNGNNQKNTKMDNPIWKEVLREFVFFFGLEVTFPAAVITGYLIYDFWKDGKNATSSSKSN